MNFSETEERTPLRFSGERLRLYAVTGSSRPGGPPLAAQVEAVLQGGASMVQLRAKGCPPAQLLPTAQALAALCHRYGVPLIVNDDPLLALRAGADGVHLGQGDLPCSQARALLGPGRIIGVSAHDPAEAEAALRAGADYLGAGAVFATATKPDATPLDHGLLRQICAVGLPVVAIGGIGAENLPQLAGTGVCGVAVVGALFGAADPAAAARQLRALADRAFG